jgi:hypothetical protein
MASVLLGVFVVGFAYWGFQLVTIIRVVRRVPVLERLPQAERELWPRVSVIITARNEEASLERAVRARLADDYPNLELILVEDRSTDRTPEIARRLASSDPRLRVVTIDELPDGWLGKVNAMQQGLSVATGDWLLFSDGDVVVGGGVLRRVVQHCDAHGFDHCAVVPALNPVSLLLDCMTSLFLRLITLTFRIWAIENPRSNASIGVGAFNFVRRAAFERTPGFEWLRMEVADDICLGQMLKAAGARQTVVNGGTSVNLVFHHSVGDALRSAERPTFTAIGNFSLARLTAIGLLLLGLELSPLVSLALARTTTAHAAAVVLVLLSLAVMIVINRWYGRSSWNLVALPAAELISFYGQVRSGVLGKWRGGIVWRGTFYPTPQLRAGRRFR